MYVRIVRGLLLVFAVMVWLFLTPLPIFPFIWQAAAFAAACYAMSALAVLRKKTYGEKAVKPKVISTKQVLNRIGDGVTIGLMLSAGAASRFYPALTAAAACTLIWLTVQGEKSENCLAALILLVGISSASAAAAGGSCFSVLSLFPAALVGYQISCGYSLSSRRLSVEYERRRISTEARDQMMATLAHEVRTPLTIMQATESVLLEETPGPLNDRQRKFLESIHTNTQRLIHFSENMLAAIKVERDWMPDRTVSIDLRRITRQVIEMIQPLLDQYRQQIRSTFPSMLAKPRADAAWIQQVLVNLVHNASKHTSEGGMIIISVTQDDERVVVTVSDNGEGLSGSGRDLLFEEFYQEQPQSGAGQDGFGLGLAIVRTVIERHGGKVYVGSSQHLGTMVSFTLPLEVSV